MNTAQYIIKRLEELNVNEFFGLPEDYNFNLIYAIENNPNTRWIGCTSALNAGYAADGYARIRGYGALVTSYGTGELAAINAIAGSAAENVPVFHLVGLPPTEVLEGNNLIHHNFQNADCERFINSYKSITETAILTKDNAKLEIDRLLKIMVRDKKPVYAALPEDIAKMEISDRVISYDWISDRQTLEELSAKIAEKIKKSHKPVIIGDVLVKRFDAEIEFKEFAEKSGIPVSNFLMGTNLISMNSENYIGGYFGEYRNPIAQKYIEESDCLIAVGVIYSDINSCGQSLPYEINNQIAIYGNYAYVEGKRYDNVKMSELLEAVTNLTETKKIEFNKPNIGLKNQEIKETNLSVSYLYSKMQEYIKENDIIFADMGTSLFGTTQLKFPDNTDFQAQALWNSAGWATPAAFGACIAKPQSRVILITGEGAHQQTAMEIGNMLRYGVKPIIVVINNNGYTTGRFFADGIHDKLNDVMQLNYAKFARVFDGDVWATRVSTAEDFDKALRVTQIMNKLCYIEACVDSLDAPFLTKDLTRKLRSLIHKNTVIINDNSTYDRIQDVVLTETNSGFEYETVVHKVFNEYSSEAKE